MRMTQCSGISRISKLFIQRKENCRYSTWCFSRWRWRLSASTRQHEQCTTRILPSIRSRSRTRVINYWNENQSYFAFKEMLKSCDINTSWQQQDLSASPSTWLYLWSMLSMLTTHWSSDARHTSISKKYRVIKSDAHPEEVLRNIITLHDAVTLRSRTLSGMSSSGPVRDTF